MLRMFVLSSNFLLSFSSILFSSYETHFGMLKNSEFFCIFCATFDRSDFRAQLCDNWKITYRDDDVMFFRWAFSTSFTPQFKLYFRIPCLLVLLHVHSATMKFRDCQLSVPMIIEMMRPNRETVKKILVQDLGKKLCKVYPAGFDWSGKTSMSGSIG